MNKPFSVFLMFFFCFNIWGQNFNYDGIQGTYRISSFILFSQSDETQQVGNCLVWDTSDGIVFLILRSGATSWRNGGTRNAFIFDKYNATLNLFETIKDSGGNVMEGVSGRLIRTGNRILFELLYRGSEQIKMEMSFFSTETGR